VSPRASYKSVALSTPRSCLQQFKIKEDRVSCLLKKKRIGKYLGHQNHECNSVVKCEGAAWCETNILRNLKRKIRCDIAYYIPIV